MVVLNEDGLPQVAIPDGRKVLSSPFGDLHAETSPNKRPRSNQKLFKSSLTNFSALKGDISINSTRSEPYSITLRCENIDDSNYFLTSNLSQQFHQHSTGTMTSQDMFRPQWLNESHVTAISRSKSFSHVQPKTAPSFSFSRHVQTPKLYFDSKYSRMYTKLVSQKLVLVSHPYDLPFSDKTTDKMGNMKSPFELHSDLNSHRNVSLPGPTQQWKTESRFDKIEYLQHSDWPRSSRIPLHSQESQKSNSAEGQNDNNKYFVPISARRAKTSHSFPSKMPVSRLILPNRLFILPTSELIKALLDSNLLRLLTDFP